MPSRESLLDGDYFEENVSTVLVSHQYQTVFLILKLLLNISNVELRIQIPNGFVSSLHYEEGLDILDI